MFYEFFSYQVQYIVHQFSNVTKEWKVIEFKCRNVFSRKEIKMTLRNSAIRWQITKEHKQTNKLITILKKIKVIEGFADYQNLP